MRKIIGCMALSAAGSAVWYLGVRSGVRRVLKAERQFAMTRRGNP